MIKIFLQDSPRVLSRNHLTTYLNIDVSKLTNRDIERIIKQWQKEKPVAEISQYFQVTRQRIYQVISTFKEIQEYPALKQPGRKPRTIDSETEELILASYHANNLSPTHLEKKIEETHGIHIPHNRIYRVLLYHGLVEINMKKRKQRKWVRYERDHSMSLWQGDWKEFTMNDRKQWLIAFMDDSSRLITCYGVFDAPTTENTLAVLRQGFAEYGIPREILTDHGTHSLRHETGNMPDTRSKSSWISTVSNISSLPLNIPRLTEKLNGSLARLNGELGSLVQSIKLFTGTMLSNLT